MTTTMKSSDGRWQVDIEHVEKFYPSEDGQGWLALIGENYSSKIYGAPCIHIDAGEVAQAIALRAARAKEAAKPPLTIEEALVVKTDGSFPQRIQNAAHEVLEVAARAIAEKEQWNPS